MSKTIRSCSNRKPYKELSGSQQQDINRQWVANEVYSCVSGMVEYILKKASYEGDSEAPFCMDDVENQFESGAEAIKSVIDAIEEDADLKKDVLAWLKDDGFESDNKTPTLKEIEKYLETLSREDLHEVGEEALIETYDYDEANEIYEWWIVSDFFLKKLSDREHPIIAHESVWGRCTTGQAILLDGVVRDICEGLWDEGYYFKDSLMPDDCYKQEEGSE